MDSLKQFAPFILTQLAPAVLGYLLGSIPFGLILTRMGGAGDIRTVGSGNIGATNVLRTGRKDLAAATLILDAGKAGLAFWLATLAVRPLFVDWTVGNDNFDVDLACFTSGLIAGAAALVGHCYPVWLRFKGGKGVATFLGLLLASMWPVALVFAASWLVTAFLLRMSSLAALVAVIVVPYLAYDFYGLRAGLITGAMSLLIIYLHRENIRRIFAGTEPRIGANKGASVGPSE